MRRTISIDKRVERLIQYCRGELLKKGLEISFTEAVNYFVMRGVADIFGLSEEERDRLSVELLAKKELKDWALWDQMQDKFIEQLPKIMQQLLSKSKGDKR